MAHHDLTGRTAIVAGASRGIGLAAARALAGAGANVVLTSRSQQAAEEAASTIEGNALGVGAHSVDENQAKRCIALTLETFGSIDILVNNAGTNPAYGPMTQQNHGQFAKTMDVNLWAPLLWTGLVAKAYMGQHGGSVINTASMGGLVHEPLIGLYNVSKAALIYLTEQLAMELSPKIRVNAIAPGVVRTKLAEALWKENEAEVAAATPLGRIGEPDNVADAITFLASDTSSWVTGETLVIDGGQRFGDAKQYRASL